MAWQVLWPGVFKPSRLIGMQDSYNSWADQFLAELRSTSPSPGNDRVLYPGLLGAELTRKRQLEGMPYHPEVLNWFETLSTELNHAGLAAAIADACKGRYNLPPVPRACTLIQRA